MKKFTLLIALIAFLAVNVVGQEVVTSSPTWDGSKNIELCSGGSFTISISGTTSGHTYNLVEASKGTKGVIQSITGTGGTITFNAVSPSATTNYSVGDATDFNPWINFSATIFSAPVAPTMDKSPNQAAVCAGTNVSATINTNGSGGVSACSDSYEYSTDGGVTWNSYTPGTTISTTGLTGTDIVQVQAIRDDSEGRGCAAYNFYKWTVNPLPIPTITGNDPVCVTLQYTYTTESGMSNYQWNTDGTTISGGGSSDNTITVSWASSGTGYVSVGYTNTNSCTSATPTTKNVTVQPTPVVQSDVTYPDGTVVTMSSGNNYATTICSGEAVTTGDATSSSADPGACGPLWVEVVSTTDISTLPPTTTQNAPVSATTPPTTITPENHDGVAKNITFVSTPYYDVDASGTLTTGDVTGEPVTFVLTVNPELVPTLTGPTTVCANSTNTYTTDAGMGNYVWTITGGTGTSSSNTIDVTWDNNLGTHSVSVTYTDGNGCPETATLDVSAEGFVQNTTTGTYYCTIQDAINAASSGNTITLLADISEGMVTINKSLTLDGDGFTLTSTSATYGILVSGVQNVTIQNITVDNPETYGIQVNPGSHYLTISDVTVKNCGTQYNGSPFASGFGINCSDHITLSDIQSYNNEGNGLVLDGCNDVTITNITTSGNSFDGNFGAGIEIAGSGAWCSPGSSSNIVIGGTINISENPEIYETGDVSNVTLPGDYTHFVGSLLPKGKS